MSGWNFADVWDAVAEVQPGELAIAENDRRETWRELEARASAVAGAFVAAGLPRQAKVAQYLYNCPEYVESVYAAFKASMVPVNTNYRYTDDELVYLWDNADVAAVVFHGSFSERIDRIRARCPLITVWLWVDDGSGPCPNWAQAYEKVVSSESAPPRTERSGDDLFLLYTGGTTGLPKGVMWRQDDLLSSINDLAQMYDPAGGLEGVKARRRAEGSGIRALPACPLMHGVGAVVAFSALLGGGAVTFSTDRTFLPQDLFATVEREKVNHVAIVGDVFARPMLEELERSPDKWNLASLVAIVSSGAMWSDEVKKGLLRHMPSVSLIDSLGSSEAMGIGGNVSTVDTPVRTAEFMLSPLAVIVGDDGELVAPGQGHVGQLAVRGRLPLGYYKDPSKTAATFPVINGVRYSVPGDYATVDAEGRVHLLGRGSACINSGGEKVFSEEVEEIVKLHPAVRDAVVVGTPHPRLGEAVTAIVELAAGARVVADDLIEHARGRIAAYKIPRRVVFVDSIARGPNGKADYRELRALATEQSGTT